MDRQANLRLALVGDCMITRHALVEQDEATRNLVRLIRDADVAFANLEVLPNDFKGYPAQEPGGTHLAADSWVVDDLLAAGFDLFATATNHALDYSIAGLQAMIEVLQQKGVSYAGVGQNLAEARMPVYHEDKGGVVALLSCSSTFFRGQIAAHQRPDMLGRPGLNPLRFDTVYEITREQMATLRSISEDLGIEQRRQENVQLGFAFGPDDPAIFPFEGMNFREAGTPATRTTPNKKDVEEIAAWVREARNRADLVIMSVHSHEQGAVKEDPAEFLPAFAKRMIDEGADIIVGTGPHLLRGMELYRGKPIFYSLGNFIAQNDLVYKVPADAYDRFRVPQTETPSAVFIGRAEGGKKGFPSDARYWESVVPLCTIEGGRLSRIELHPITLGHTDPAYLRGRPRLASSDDAGRILNRFAKLSEPFGTEIRIEGGIGVVEVRG